ncbi:hypothetical protein H5410_030578 [Solanum commersonii]|uniref:DUF7746 domain-containing protein n=1 Tax=Solanum commersonii TaxID=4109 RepID=A0A9J5YHS5_SOLCO|nr:hypothetical protein H5410_030578 [Solanum commersonii]
MIFLLENSDLQRKDEPWKIFQRYNRQSLSSRRRFPVIHHISHVEPVYGSARGRAASLHTIATDSNSLVEKGNPRKNSGYATKPSMNTYYYPRPTPQDVLINERDWNQTNTSNSGFKIYEWNLDGFTGQLRGRWDNYLNVEEQASIINAVATDDGVDNLGMALVRNREEALYTLVLTILEHFNCRFTIQHETVHTLPNGLRCQTLWHFLWYKDTFLEKLRL